MAWSVDRPDPVWIKTDADASRLLEKLTRVDLIAVDTETTGLDIIRDQIEFFSLSTGDDRYFMQRRMLGNFRKLFEDPDKTWVGTHTKYDAHMLANAGIQLRGDIICTLVMDRLLNPDNDHGLKEVYEREFDERVLSFGEVFFPKNSKGRPQKPKNKSLIEIMRQAWSERPDDVVDYSTLDAWMSFRVYRRLEEYLDEISTWRGESLLDLYYRFEVPFTKILFRMERRGIQIDTQYLESLRPKIVEEQDKVKKLLAKAAGQIVNPDSPLQLQHLFFKKLGLPVIKRTKGGAPSTDIHVLEEYAAAGVKEAALVIRHRKLGKILGTYVDGMLALVINGRIHGSFNQHVTETARLSSTNPNLQNIPRPDSDEFKIRRAFIARPGYKFVTSDYDQLEMFLAAHWSRDKGMIANIMAGRDLHAGNAALVWGEDYDDIVKAKKKDPEKEKLTEREWLLREYRQFVKIIGFGLLYGKAANKLAAELKIIDKVQAEHPDWDEKHVKWEAKDRAQAIIDKFFAGIPGVAKFIRRTHKRVADTKYVESLSGRRRWLLEVLDLDVKERHQRDAELERLEMGRSAVGALCWCDDCRESRGGERKAVNTIIQESAADVTQAAMITCSRDPALSSVEMVLQVHDEVGFEVPEEILEEAKVRIKYNMEHPDYDFIDDLRVPLKAGPGAGDNWVEAKA